MSKTAIVFGATGLVGSFLVRRLLDDDRYATVKLFVRRASALQHPKLDQHVIDFTRLDDFRDRVAGDELHCCLGTTIRVAGSQEAFRKVDYDAVVWCASAAAANGVPRFLVVSSVGASPKTWNFYLRTKGEMEDAVRALPFRQCVILRPSTLLGPRAEFRLGELIAKSGMRALSFAIPKRYKPVHAETVARAMVAAANDPSVNGVLENEDVRALGAASR